MTDQLDLLPASHSKLADGVRKAISEGHTPEWDPSGQGFARFTCTNCGRAALQPFSVVYGSMLEGPCP